MRSWDSHKGIAIPTREPGAPHIRVRCECVSVDHTTKLAAHNFNLARGVSPRSREDCGAVQHGDYDERIFVRNVGDHIVPHQVKP
jgi:hypothetical protein